MTQPVDWVDDTLHYRFRDPALLEQALTHRSASAAHNERLEYLGDAVLGLVTADVLYAAYPAASEGAMSRLRARLVRRTTLEALAREIDLGSHVRLGSGEFRTGGHHRGSILANSLEAIFGAIFLDGGYAAAGEAIRRLLESRIAALDGDDELRDPKTRLQELLQGRGLPLPVYEVAEVGGTQHAQQFVVLCRVDELGISVTGTGPSRRGAEQEAAATVLTALEHGN